MFRLRKDIARHVIDEIRPYLVATRTTSCPDFIIVLTALNFFGNGSYQLGVGANNLFGLSQPSVSRCIAKVTDIIVNHLGQRWITFPISRREKNEKKACFLQQYNFPNIIGAIDCSHISIIAPPIYDEQYPGRVYFNRKGFASINTQIICDADLRILNINARFPGSTHDSAIWMVSNIRRHLVNNFLNRDEQTHLLGDSGYPTEPWLLTLFNNTIQGTPESRYNSRHIAARNCIERLNGVLKSRFRCLLRHWTLNYHPVKSASIQPYAVSFHVIHNVPLSTISR